MKGRLIFKTNKQAGKVCTLLNNITDAEYNKRYHHFYTFKKSLIYEIYGIMEQKELMRKIKKLNLLNKKIQKSTIQKCKREVKMMMATIRKGK